MFDAHDRLLIYELDADSRQSIKDLSKKIRLNHESTRYRLLRLQEKGVIKQCAAHLDFSRLGYAGYCVYCRYKTPIKEEKEALHAYLREHKQVYWVAEYGGTHDFAFAVFAQSPESFSHIYDEIVEHCSRYLKDFTFVIKLGAQKYPRAYLHREKPPVAAKSSGSPYALSATESSVLRELCSDARMSATEISTNTKIPLTTVLYTIRNLEKQEIIAGYTVVLNPQTLGMQSYQVNVVTKALSAKQLSSFFTYCAQNKWIVLALRVLGPWNLEVIYEVPDARTMQEELIRLRQAFADAIEETELSTVFEDYIKLNHYPF